MGRILDILIVLAIAGLGVTVAIRMVRNRRKGGCCGGCTGCPYAGKCDKQEAKKHE